MSDSEEDYSGSDEEDSEVRYYTIATVTLNTLVLQVDEEVDDYPSSKRPRIANRFILDEAGEV